MDCLMTKEVQKLIALLGKIPNIHLPHERPALLAGLPQEVLNNIPLGHGASVDIFNIVTTLSGEAYFCYNKTYPIVTIIQNAQNKIGNGELSPQLEEFLEEMCQCHNIDLTTRSKLLTERAPLPLSHASISEFRKKLDSFLEVVEAYRQGLPDDITVFKKHVFPRGCKKIHARLNDVLLYSVKFALTLQPSNNTPPVVIAHGLQLLKEINVFEKNGQRLSSLIHDFCQTYGSALSQSEEQRKGIHQQLGNLINQCTVIVSEVEKLRKHL